MPMEIVRDSIVIIFFTTLIFLVPVFAQLKFLEIDVDNFKRKIKINKFKFMFRATGNRKVDEDGIIKSLFYLQISGYVISLLTLSLNIVLLILNEPILTGIIVTTCVLGIEVVATILMMVIMIIISKRRDAISNDISGQNEKNRFIRK